MKTCSRELPPLWERLKHWYQLESAKGSELSVHGAAFYFTIELEDGISSLKRKGEECSPDELRRIQQGERRLENLKKIHNWKRLRACAKYELQIVSEENSTRGSAEGAREGKRGSAEGRGKRQEDNSMHSLASTPRPRWKRLGSGERLELANLEAGCHE